MRIVATILLLALAACSDNTRATDTSAPGTFTTVTGQVDTTVLGVSASVVLRPWREPNGGFTIGVPADWRRIPLTENGELLKVGLPARPGEDDGPECEADRYSTPPTATSNDQTALNAVYAAASAHGPNVQGFNNTLVDGVRVVTRNNNPSGDFYFDREFLIATAQGPRHYFIRCTASIDTSHAQDVANAKAVLNSLRFSQQTQNNASPPTPLLFEARKDEVRWTDSTGRITLSWPVGAWTPADPVRNAELFHGDMLILAAEGYAHAQCRVYLTLQPLPAPQTRAKLNEATRALINGPLLRDMAARPGFALDSSGLTEVNGVLVLDTRTTFNGDIITSSRRFLLQGQDLQLYTLECSAKADEQYALSVAQALPRTLEIQDR